MERNTIIYLFLFLVLCPQVKSQILGQWFLDKESENNIELIIKTSKEEISSYIENRERDISNTYYRYDTYKDDGEVSLREGMIENYRLVNDSLYIYPDFNKENNTKAYHCLINNDKMILITNKTKEYQEMMDIFKEQVNIEKVEMKLVFTKLYEEAEVDDLPQFPGGKKALQSFFSKRMTYPHDLKGSGIGLTLFINKTGEASLFSRYNSTEYNIKENYGELIIDDKSIGEIRYYAVKVLDEMPKWKPAVKNSLLVNSVIDIVVTFK